jgi:AcrR family transcriptional regulator
MIAKPVDTKTRILDSAEKLFGINGFDATSLRDITTEADVNLAAVNYHFQSKDSLIEAVIARRIEPINQARLALLDAAGREPTVEQILIAYLGPIFDKDISPAVMAQMLAAPDIFVTQLYRKHLVSIVERFTAALRKALPEVREVELLWRLHFSAGAMTNVLARGHLLGELTHGLCDPSDRPAMLARLVTFCAAGLRATEGF